MTPGGGAFALIPARGGSKGIPFKNLATVGGKSLLEHAVRAAQTSGVIDRIFVSSDSEHILEAAINLHAECVRRPAELATNSATGDSVVAHFIQALHLEGQPSRPIVLLQPTSPLRTGAHIAHAVAIWKKTSAQAVISVFEPEHHPAKSFRLDEAGMLAGLYGPDAPFTARQELPKALQPNGAIYVFSVEAFMGQNCIPRRQLAPFVMDPQDSLDIDTPQDLIRAERHFRGESNDG